MKSAAVKISDIIIGSNRPFVLIAGPCVIESRESALYHAVKLREITKSLNIPFIYKASYDKANRTSAKSFRGPGLKKGLEILRMVKDKTGVLVLSDVHCRQDLKEASRVLDVIQIPAFLCRQTDFITACAQTGRPINIKKGQFLAPWDMKHAVDKAASTGNKKIIITERGTSFGYNNLVSDMRSIPILKKLGFPVIYDATHSVQLPGGLKNASGGQREFVFPLASAAIAVGVDGLFLEVHKDPKAALSDGPNMVYLKDLKDLLLKLKKIDMAVKR
ncbi:MAG: 3-deoxy-8-phosphooctulonate synthase [Candidatus Omnitrophica bacterium]|nr:3-deoxy-8-phosphooctulonate synthase [Candidatus Omnitrophota bacterium]